MTITTPTFPPICRVRRSGETINGYCFAWNNDKPVWMHILSGNKDVYLLIFSSSDKLKYVMSMIGVSYNKIKKIDDEHEFLDSIPSKLPDGTQIHIIIDPSLTEGGNIMYDELMRD